MATDADVDAFLGVNSPAAQGGSQSSGPLVVTIHPHYTQDSAPTPATDADVDSFLAADHSSNYTKPQSRNTAYRDLVKSTLQSNHYTPMPTTPQQIANRQNDTTARDAGFTRGLNDAVHSLDPAAQWLQNKLGTYTIGGMLPTAEQAAQYNATDRQNFDSQYGNNSVATVGRVGGQAAATLPLLAGAGSMLKAGGGALLDAAPEAAQSALQGAGRFLSGNAGANAAGAGNTLLRYLSGGANGGVVGGTAGALTSGQSDAPLSDQVGMGAALGGAFGAAFPVIRSAASAIGSGIKSVVNPIIDRFGNQVPVAANKLMQALSRDGLSMENIQHILAGLGPDAVVADAGGANTQGLARAVAGIPGTGKDLAASTLAGRQEGQAGRVLQAVSDHLSPSTDTHGIIDSLIADRKAAAAPLYDKAYSAPALNPDLIEHGGALDQMMSRPAMQKAAAGALNLAKEEGRDPASLGITVDAQGNAMFEKVPSWQTLDYVKRGLDDVLGKYRDPTTGKLVLDNAGRSVNQTLHDFTDLVDKQNPAYAQARAAYAGPSQTIDAINMGSRFVRNDPEVTAKVMSAMSDQDKESFRIGVARELQDAIHKTPDGADVVKRIFNNQDKRNKLAAVFPSDQAFQDFSAAMQRESTLYKNSANILQGSRTAPMAAEMQDSGINPGHIFTGVKAVSGNYAGAASDVLRGVVNKLMPMPEDRASELAKLLFSRDTSSLGQNVNNRAAPSFLGNAIQGASDPRYVIPAAVIGSNRLIRAGRASPP